MAKKLNDPNQLSFLVKNPNLEGELSKLESVPTKHKPQKTINKLEKSNPIYIDNYKTINVFSNNTVRTNVFAVKITVRKSIKFLISVIALVFTCFISRIWLITLSVVWCRTRI